MNYIYQKKSNIAGSGIFTKKNIKKGDYVCRIKGRKFIWKYNEKTDRDLGANWFGLGRNIWVDPIFPLSHINHSCEPNIGIKGSVMFYALQNIKEGEELTFDYSTSDEEIDWKMKCNCGAFSCRKYMTAIQLLPYKIYKSYLPYVPTYFQKVYKRYNNLK